MLTIKYERKDFFGQYQYTEDSKDNYNRNDVKKAFLFLGKNRDVSVQIENIIYFWDSIVDFENQIMTVRTFDKMNCRSYTDVKMAFDKAKKEVYQECCAMVQ